MEEYNINIENNKTNNIKNSVWFLEYSSKYTVNYLIKT